MSSSNPPANPQGTVEAARARVEPWFHPNGHGFDALNALIAAAHAEGRAEAVLEWSERIRREHRAEMLREVRKAIEDMPSDQADCVPWLDILAAIDALGQP